jgi:hypothetical protein
MDLTSCNILKTGSAVLLNCSQLQKEEDLSKKLALVPVVDEVLAVGAS